MTELFDDTYRIKSLRLTERDYSQAGSYFITICTQWRKSYFGEIIDSDVKLNDMGKIVQDIWMDIPYHFENVELDVCLIMPNHVHWIITINDIVETHDRVSYKENETRHGMSLRKKNKFWSRNKNSLSLIINQFKWSITREIHKHIPTFKWQANYYEHVIRNEKDLERIRTYIINNPWKWRNDEYYR